MKTLSLRSFLGSLLILSFLLSVLSVFIAMHYWRQMTTSTAVVSLARGNMLDGFLAPFLPIYRADGTCDEKTINAAIRSLPPAGGIVHIKAGKYSICHKEGTYGGIIIDRSNVTLQGEGNATELRLAAGQYTNVIRIIGKGVHHVVIRYLAIDGNAAANTLDINDPKVRKPGIPHSGFEICGIKAHYIGPDDYEAGSSETPQDFLHDIIVRNVHVRDSARLNVMLSGVNIHLVDSHLGDAGSDSVELLFGPGSIKRNTLTVRKKTYVGLGTDAANFVTIEGNIVTIKAGAELGEGIRTWAGSVGHIISGNQIVLEEGGRITWPFSINGSDTIITNNLFYNFNPKQVVDSNVADGKNNLAIGNIFYHQPKGAAMGKLMPAGPFNIMPED